MSGILVGGWCLTVLVYKQYVKVTKMTKIENSVYKQVYVEIWYTGIKSEKNLYKVIEQPFFGR